VITVFSAPNYCDVYKNKAAIIKIEGDSFNIKNFEEVPHPYHLPGNLNLFQFSMPYVAEKVMDMLFNILSRVTSDEQQPADVVTFEDFQRILLSNGG
jgi:serine/threonine-protein phosphatase 2B catalytic subunit